MATDFRLGVLGGMGRLGQRVVSLANEHPRIELVGCLVREGYGETSTACFTDAEAFFAEIDVLVDVSLPHVIEKHAQGLKSQRQISVVSGVTGHSEAEWVVLKDLSESLALFHAHNFSKGMALFRKIIQGLPESCPEGKWDVTDIHHDQKKDTPSGTAKAICQDLGIDPDQVHAVRAGDVIGEHDVTCFLPFERIEICHKAESRDVFAHGALDAAQYVWGRKPGLYGMDDLIAQSHPG